VSGECQRLLVLAREESESLHHGSIDSGHLVLAALRIKDCTAAEILQRYGIEYEEYRELLRGEVPAASGYVQLDVGDRLDAAKLSFSAIPALLPYILRMNWLIDEAARHLYGQSEIDGEVRLKRAPWTRQEALGHLVDWATSHQQWFARALSENKVVSTSYPPPEWVTAQAYLQFGWQDLVDLWVCINRLLLHVLARVPEEKLETPCRIGIDPPIPLSKLIANYVDHCEDIIAQILARGWRSRPAPE
jgi:hypothetical protein